MLQKFGQAVRDERKAKGLTIRSLAELCDMDFTYLSKIENGKVLAPPFSTIIRICEAMDSDQAYELVALSGRINEPMYRHKISQYEDFGRLLTDLLRYELADSDIDDIRRLVRDRRNGDPA